MSLLNKTKNAILAQSVIIADTPFPRMRGLLGRKEFNPGEALIIKPCNAIHTFFMPFAIDCLFVDKNNRVIKSISKLPAFRMTFPCFASKLVIELPAGTLNITSTQIGDILSF